MRGRIIRAEELQVGDSFETLHTSGHGLRKDRDVGLWSGGIPVMIDYPNGGHVNRMLHVSVRVRLIGKGQLAA